MGMDLGGEGRAKEFTCCVASFRLLRPLPFSSIPFSFLNSRNPVLNSFSPLLANMRLYTSQNRSVTSCTILLIYISASIMRQNYQISNKNIGKSVRFRNYIEFLIKWRKPHYSSSIRLEMTSEIRLLPHGENGENFSFRNPTF